MRVKYILTELQAYSRPRYLLTKIFEGISYSTFFVSVAESGGLEINSWQNTWWLSKLEDLLENN
jgi:hypothetical protein